MNLQHVSVFLLVGLIASLGCGSNPATEPDVPSPEVFTLESVEAGVNKLKELNATIKAAFDAGTPHESDGALHEAAAIVNALPQTATDEGITAEGLQTVTENSKALLTPADTTRDLFGPTRAGGGSNTPTPNTPSSGSKNRQMFS